MSVAITLALQLELNGVGGGWTDVAADVRMGDGLTIDYGIQGATALDRVASTGHCTFVLDNMATNSAGLIGYYSPNHANVRSGFGLGIGVRVAITYSGTTYYKFRGVLDSIQPEPGVSRGRRVFCTAVDWMDEAARWKVTSLATQVGQRSDQVFSTIVAAVPSQPAAQSVATGLSTFPYALDTSRDESMMALSEFQRVAVSEPGYIFIKGDTTQGGTLVFENRQTRLINTTNAVTFDNTMLQMDVARLRSDVLNKTQVTVHPRQVDAAATTVLYSLQQPTTNSIAPGQTLVLLGPYRDPNQRAARVGGTAMVSPVSTTDYTMHSAADGTGSDLTADFSVTAALGGNGARFTITNNGATAGYITKLQCRGKGIYDYENALMESSDSTSITAYGEHVLSFDMWYQSDPVFGQAVSEWLLHLFDSALTYVNRVGFYASDTAALMSAALTSDISTRVGLVETVSGLTDVIPSSSATNGYYINSVRLQIGAGDLLYCSWGLTPADTLQYWLLGQVGASEVGVTTRLGYI
ncbi:MAG: hypothetical protein NUW22_12570 [Acidobacteria bacterium]|nr:hypothetical protein [Acidobacteriota bacterium]